MYPVGYSPFRRTRLILKAPETVEEISAASNDGHSGQIFLYLNLDRCSGFLRNFALSGGGWGAIIVVAYM